MNPIGRAKSMVGLRNSGRANGGRLLLGRHQSPRSSSAPQTFLYQATTLAVAPDERTRAAIPTASFRKFAAQALSEPNIAGLVSGYYQWAGGGDQAPSAAVSRNVCNGSQRRLELEG
jgi:hypothetical protein